MPTSTTASQVLELDYSLWDPANITSPSSLQFIDSLRAALFGLGFFALTNTPLSNPETRNKIFESTKAFFSLPLETRNQIDMAKSKHFRGFAKFGDETTQTKTDLRDQIDFATDAEPLNLPEELLREKPFLNLYGRNQFLPDTVLPGYRELVLDWFDKADKVSRNLTRALEVALGVEEGRLTQYLDGWDSGGTVHGSLPFARMKTIRYPAGDIVDGIQRPAGTTQGVGAHKDGGWLTLLATSEVEGLQIQDFDGNWITVPYLPTTILINFDQQIENVTSGIAQAATHRVISSGARTHETRYSVAWFSLPALNARLKPIDLATELDPVVLEQWNQFQRERGGKEVVCDVPKGDLFPKLEEEFGWTAWRGLYRSHPRVVEIFYSDY
ncbi:UNVERIFIED_CONTAM: hypothetical protein HDU68_003405 [Siphonaria sp. JEL0065]|nr:hypothetical protein HDU68_003405 [Siphonaria sp. JEL0065]